MRGSVKILFQFLSFLNDPRVADGALAATSGAFIHWVKMNLQYFQTRNLKMSLLYSDIIQYISSFVDLQTLGRMSQTSKDMKNLISDDKKDLRVEKYIKNETMKRIENLLQLFLRCCKTGGPIIVIRYIIKNKCVDPSTNDNYAIKWASYYGHLEVVKLLLSDPRVDPNVDDKYALRWANYYRHREIVNLLMGTDFYKKRTNPSDK